MQLWRKRSPPTCLAMAPPRIIAAMTSAAMDSNRSAPRAAQSPTLSPTKSAITAGFLQAQQGEGRDANRLWAPTALPRVALQPPWCNMVQPCRTGGLVKKAKAPHEGSLSETPAFPCHIACVRVYISHAFRLHPKNANRRPHLGSSSGMPASTLPTRSAPTSAALVKIPPPEGGPRQGGQG